MGSALALGFSIWGRYVCRKNFVPCTIFSANILLVPGLYFMAFRRKHVDYEMGTTRKRYNIVNIDLTLMNVWNFIQLLEEHGIEL